MVSAFRVDSLRDPTAALIELYDDSASTADNFPRLVSDHFAHVFCSQDAYHEIPTLDVQHPPDAFPDRALVRFRAMVQDTSPSSEMYLATSPAGKCGGWGIDTGDPDGAQGVDYAHLRECSVLWAVSVPGETEWCAEELNGPESHQERPPRPASTSSYQSQHAYKYPHPSVPHIGLQVKTYDTDGAETLKSTDVVTFVGILTTEPLSSDLDAASSEVPTLHVLFSRPHSQPLLSRPYPYLNTPESTADTARSETAENTNPTRIRTALVKWIADEALGGDAQAAEWVLLSCVARVQSRSPPLLPPSLTLAHFPAPPPSPSPSTGDADEGVLPNPTLSIVLALLLPLTHTLALSLPALNAGAFAPESKHEDLHAGALQLPQGTVLLVTEGGVREGQLVERGLLNVRALQEVMSTQTLVYAFPFSQFSFPTDISCIVLGEGSKSAFFKTDLCVPLNAPHTPAATSVLYKPASSIIRPPPAQLAAFRALILGARTGRVAVSEETSEYIQSDFVRERKRDTAVTSDDLIRRMTVAKLYALSMHETELTVDVWERAKALDQHRLALLAK
ncbi:mini-chromosome maintenance replisome factor-domain-containing protein [Sparassis latifolia]